MSAIASDVHASTATETSQAPTPASALMVLAVSALVIAYLCLYPFVLSGPLAGIEAALRASGTFDYRNPTWKIDGLRHLMTPRLSYRSIPGAERGRAWIPRIDRDRTSHLDPIPGNPPSLIALPPGCVFAPRCAYVEQVPGGACRSVRPDLEPSTTGHLVRCHLPSERRRAIASERLSQAGLPDAEGAGDG